MKSIKRVLALAVVFAMVLGSMAAFAYSDVSADLNTPVKVLTSLKVFEGYPDGSFKPEGTIIRSEAAAVIARLVGAGEIGKTKVATAFSDVAAEHWASGYVKLGADLAVIDGFPDGTYQPDSKLTFEQVVKMVVCALGYRAEAEAKGGYPTGYLYVAGTIGLTEGIASTAGNAEASRGTVATLLYNALDIPLALRETYGDETKYVVQDGVQTEYRITALSKYFGVAKLAGVVVADHVAGQKEGQVSFKVVDTFKTEFVEFAAGSTGAEFLKNKVYTFYEGDTNASSYIGKPVIVFVKVSRTNLDDSVIIDIQENAQGDTLLLQSRELGEVDNGYSSSKDKYTYSTDEFDTEKTFLTSNNATVWFNGVEMEDSDEFYDWLFEIKDGERTENLVPRYATLLFAKSAKNVDAFDLIFVTEYQTLVVDKDVATNATTLKGKGTKSDFLETKIPLDDDFVKVSLTDKDGKEVAFADLKEKDVITFVMSKGVGASDGYEFWNGVVTREVVNGKVEFVNGQGILQKVTLDGKDYLVATDEAIRKGVTGDFALDANGRIAYTDKKTTSEKYAYVLEADGNDTLGTTVDKNKEVTLIVEPNGAKKTFDVSSSVEINSKAYSKVDAADRAKVGELIRFVESDGVITSIFTIDNDIAFDDYAANVGEDILVQPKSDYVKMDKFNVAKDAVVFFANPGAGERAIKVMSAEDLEKDAKLFENTVSFYNKIGGYYTLVWVQDVPAEKKDSQIMMAVKSVQTGATCKVTGYVEGQIVEYETEDDDVFGIAKGEVIYPVISSEGKLVGVRLPISKDDQDAAANNIYKAAFYHGEITGLDNTDVTVKIVEVDGSTTTTQDLSDIDLVVIDGNSFSLEDIEKYEESELLGAEIWIKVYDEDVTDVVIKLTNS